MSSLRGDLSCAESIWSVFYETGRRNNHMPIVLDVTSIGYTSIFLAVDFVAMFRFSNKTDERWCVHGNMLP